MKFSLSHIATAAALLTAAPLLAVSAIAAEPEDETTDEATQEQAEEAREAAPIVIPEVKDEKRICRRVKLDMSSRRATKVCKTADEWREFNQRR